MNSVSKTLFIPFYFRYKESLFQKEIYDDVAIQFFKDSKNLNLINFSALDQDVNSYIGTIARTKIIDSYLLKLLEFPIDNIFNIGCGLDFKNRRLNILKSWYNIDFSSVIQFRNNNFLKCDLEKNIEGDILKSFNWNFIPNEINVFILEGVSMYLKEEELLSFIKNMCEFSKKAYFIIETVPLEAVGVKHPSVEKVDESLTFKWGTNNIEEFSKKANLKMIDSHKHGDILKDRWPKYDESNKLLQAFKNGYKINLFEN